MVNGKCSIAAAERAAVLINATGAVEEEETANLIPLGIFIGATASIVINVSQNMLARGGRAGVWVPLFALAAISNFVAFSFAPGSVLSPLEGLQFISNLAFGFITGNPGLLYPMAGQKPDTNNPKVSKQPSRSRFDWDRVTPYGRRSILGTAVVIGGVVLPVLGGAGTPPAKFDEEAIECFWRQSTTIVYLAVCVVVSAACLIAWKSMRSEKYVRSKRDLEDDKLVVRSIWAKHGCDTKKALKAGAAEVAEFRRQTRLKHVDTRWYSLALYGLGAALIGGLAVIQAKAISELIEILIQEGFGIMRRPLIWVTSVLVAGLFVAWLKLLEYAPLIFPQIAAIPTLQGGYIIFASIGPGIFLEELQQLSTLNLVLFFSGMALIATGVALMLSSGPPEKPFYQATFWWGVGSREYDPYSLSFRPEAEIPNIPPGLLNAHAEPKSAAEARRKRQLLREWDKYLAEKEEALKAHKQEYEENGPEAEKAARGEAVAILGVPAEATVVGVVQGVALKQEMLPLLSMRGV